MAAQDDLEREFDMLMRKAGLSILPDRKAGILAAYAELKDHAAMVHRSMPAADDPAYVFSLETLLRRS